MNHLAQITQLIIILFIPVTHADSQKFLNSLSSEANDTHMSNPKQSNSLKAEPLALPSKGFDKTKASIAIGNQLSDILNRVKSGAIDKEDISGEVEKLVSAALIKGVDMTQLRSLVSDALAGIEKEEAAKGHHDLALEEVSSSVNKLLVAEPAKKVDSAQTAYLTSIHSLVGKAMVKTDQPEEGETKEKIRVDDKTTAEVEEKASIVPEDYEEITVLTGESLYTIALRIYGTGDKFLELYSINKDRISNPDLIKVGQKLRIPTMDKPIEKIETPTKELNKPSEVVNENS